MALSAMKPVSLTVKTVCPTHTSDKVIQFLCTGFTQSDKLCSYNSEVITCFICSVLICVFIVIFSKTLRQTRQKKSIKVINEFLLYRLKNSVLFVLMSCVFYTLIFTDSPEYPRTWRPFT
jgi:hypothetical protein